MKVYITHYTPLKERKPHIIKELCSKHIYNFEFIETYDKEVLTNFELSKFNTIKLSEISLFLKHIEVMKKALLQEDDLICVFEDDSILKNNFYEVINNIISNQPKEWDVIFTAECVKLHIDYNPYGITIPVYSSHPPYLFETNGSRGTCMYIINKTACRKILDIYNNQSIINNAIDHWFNEIYKYGNLKYYWSEPTVVDQGSEHIFNSSIR